MHFVLKYKQFRTVYSFYIHACRSELAVDTYGLLILPECRIKVEVDEYVRSIRSTCMNASRTKIKVEAYGMLILPACRLKIEVYTYSIHSTCVSY